MDSHLIAVKIGVECGAYQRMQLDSLSFNQRRFKSLNTQSMQSRGAVEHHRMLTNDLI